MTTISNIAQRVLSENSYTTSDCSLVNTEYLIKKAVDHVNMRTGGSVSFTLSGGTQSLTGTDAQLVTIQNLSALLLRAFVDRGPNTSLGGVSVSTLTADPQYSIHMKLMEDEIRELIGVSVQRT
jgi:hypothetical protein